MSLGTDDASHRLAREEPIENVEADVPARGAPRDEAAIDVVPEREARAAAERFELPAERRRPPVCTRAASAPPARFTVVSETSGVVRRSRASPARRSPGSDRRRTAPILGGAPDRSAPARPLPAGDEGHGPERASTRPLPSDLRACGGARHVALAVAHRFLPFRRARRFLRFGAGCCSMRSRWRSRRIDVGRPESSERREPGIQLHEGFGRSR